MSDVKLRTLANFGSINEAEALRTALETQGIPCGLSNSADVTNLGFSFEDVAV